MTDTAERAPRSTPFTVEVLGESITAEFDDPALAQAIAAQFRAGGARVTFEPPAAAGRALVRTRAFLGALDGPTAPLWRGAKIHRSRDVERADGVSVLVTHPPTSITVADGRTIEVLRCDAEADLGHLHHMVKYPLRERLEARGNVLLHASGVRLDGDAAALFVGDSGAGKTTIMVELLTTGMTVLGNDSIFAVADGAGCRAVPWPHVLRLASGTLDHNTVLADTPERPRWKRGRDGKAEIYFDTLERIFGRTLVGAPAALTHVVEVRLAQDERLDLQRLFGAEREAVLRERVLDDRFPAAWLPGWPWGEPPGAARAITERLLRTVAVYRLRVGVRRPKWGPELRDLVERRLRL